MKNLELGKQFCEKAINLDASNFKAYNYLGNCLDDLNIVDKMIGKKDFISILEIRA